MDWQRLLGRTVSVKLTEDGEAFVSTVRYGRLFRWSKVWQIESRETGNRESTVQPRFGGETNEPGGDQPDQPVRSS